MSFAPALPPILMIVCLAVLVLYSARAYSRSHKLKLLPLRLLAMLMLATVLFSPVYSTDLPSAAPQLPTSIVAFDHGTTLPRITPRSDIIILEPPFDASAPSLAERIKWALAKTSGSVKKLLVVTGKSGNTPELLALLSRLKKAGANVILVQNTKPQEYERRLESIEIKKIPNSADVMLAATFYSPCRAVTPLEVAVYLNNEQVFTQTIQDNSDEKYLTQKWRIPITTSGLARLNVRSRTASGSETARGQFFMTSSASRSILITEGVPREVYFGAASAIAKSNSATLSTSTSLTRKKFEYALPSSLKKLLSYDLLIIGSLTRRGLSRSSLEQLKEYLKSGGGILFVTPSLSTQHVLAEIMPTEPIAPEIISGSFMVAPEGKLGNRRPFPFGPTTQTAYQTFDTQSIERRKRASSWQELPPIEDLVKAGALKSNAGLTLSGVGGQSRATLPVLVEAKVAQGRVAVLFVNSFSPWQNSGPGDKIAHDEFWIDLSTSLARVDKKSPLRVWCEAEGNNITAFLTDPNAKLELLDRKTNEVIGMMPGGHVRKITLDVTEKNIYAQATLKKQQARCNLLKFKARVPLNEKSSLVSELAQNALPLIASASYKPSEIASALDVFGKPAKAAESTLTKKGREKLIPDALSFVIIILVLLIEWIMITRGERNARP